MSELDKTGWVWLQGQIVGNQESWSTVSRWDGEYYATREDACRNGLRELDHDDFNVGYLDGGKLTWFGWMDDQHPEHEYAEIAEQFGWSA